MANGIRMANWQLLVAVDYNQQRTMAKERVDPIHWLLPSTLYKVCTRSAPLAQYKLVLLQESNPRPSICEAASYAVALS